MLNNIFDLNPINSEIAIFSCCFIPPEQVQYHILLILRYTLNKKEGRKEGRKPLARINVSKGFVIQIFRSVGQSFDVVMSGPFNKLNLVKENSTAVLRLPQSIWDTN